MEGKTRRIPVVNQSYMRSQQHENMQMKRKRKRLLRRLTVFFTFAFLLTFFFIRTLMAQEEMLRTKNEQLKTTEAELEKMKEHQRALQEEIMKLQDEEYIGKYARQEYFLSDDGEIIFSIPNEEDEQDAD